MGLGKVIIIGGLALVLIGLLYSYFPTAVNWIGKLPGDIRIEKERGSFYFPITSMIILSVILNLVIRLLKGL